MTRVPGVEYVVDLLLQVGATGTPVSSGLTGLQLPQLAALSVIEGTPLPLTNLADNPPRTVPSVVPVPVSKAQC